MQKSDKDNHIKLKLYYLIVLLNILRNKMKKIIITRLNYIVEKHNLLLMKHTEDKKLTSIENILYIITEEIYAV